PFFVLLLGLNSPLHGLLHTFLLAVPAGFVLGVIMRALEPALAPLHKALLLEPREGSVSAASSSLELLEQCRTYCWTHHCTMTLCLSTR
ncbi:MAG: hypothetical protein QXD46_05430, partial [Thermofilum sp.]